MNQIICGNCIEELTKIPDNCIQACITSPPYASQRKNLYDSIPEENYPQWTVNWMQAVRPKLKENASVLIIIRPNLKNGQISNYVLKTRLALREYKWIECEELIWLKTDAPPLGSPKRPRRTWESILWFSKTGNPFVNLYACGNPKSKKTGCFTGSERFTGDVTAKTQNRNVKEGTSRVSDVFTAKICQNAKGIMHPAIFPQVLSDQLVQTFSNANDLILDPFMGSGTTALSAKTFGRQYLGFDTNPEYVEIAVKRLSCPS